MKEGEDVPADILKLLQVDIQKVRLEIDKLHHKMRSQWASCR